MEALFCTYHGGERPHLGRVTHEIAAGPAGQGAAPGLVRRGLEQAPSPDGRSTPALAGNVLVYLTEAGTLLCVDFGGTGRMVLASGLEAATPRLRGGEVIGALSGDGGVRYLAWGGRDLRDALRLGRGNVAPRSIEATGVHLLGLPSDRSRPHPGTGRSRGSAGRGGCSPSRTPPRAPRRRRSGATSASAPRGRSTPARIGRR